MVWGSLAFKAPEILVTTSRPWPHPSPTEADAFGNKTWGSLAPPAPQGSFVENHCNMINPIIEKCRLSVEFAGDTPNQHGP